jgi:hypothetical protein
MLSDHPVENEEPNDAPAGFGSPNAVCLND